MNQVGIFAGGAALVFSAFLLGARARAVEPGLHERYSTDLARLETLDHRLNEDLMRARTGLLANYDSLVVTLRELRFIHDRLGEVPDYVDEEGRVELAAALRSSRAALLEQGDLLERFKSENAVLLNSLRYLPLAASDLTLDIEDPELLARVDALVRDVLVLNLWNDLELVVRVQERLAQLTQSELAERREMELLRLHTGVVLERRPRVQHLLEEILAQHSTREAYRLDELYRAHHATAARRTQTDEIVLFAVALLSVLLVSALVITRMRRTAFALRRTSEDLARAVDTKNRFVAMTSHEFRTPLSVILSSTELLEAYGDRWPTDKRRSHFERIRGSIGGMSQLIDGVLLIGKGEARVLDFKPEKIDVDRIAVEVIAALAARSSTRRDVSYKPPEQTEVVADGRLLRHVLDNLLSNAIKYSPDGGEVTLELRVEDDALIVRVSDKGVGVPEADQAALFESFQRGSNVGDIPGTGLGLAVVKRAAELHGGSVSMQSVVGVGSAFEVRLAVKHGDGGLRA